jgi:amino acid transporter
MSAETKDALDLESAGDDIELVNEKALNWFDVSAIGTGEMLFTAGWAWIMYIASLYGIKWTLIGFVVGAVIINCAWWLYREMITAVPEPGSIQSYGRESRLFSLGTAYFVSYTLVYGAFMWLELVVGQGLLSLMFPHVDKWIWPFVIIGPVVALNLYGTQITGKVQSALVVVTLVGDVFLAIAVWMLLADAKIWGANWESPTPINWMSLFHVTALWIGIMAAVLEVQQVLVDEWHDFERSRDVGLLSAAWQLWVRQIPFAFALLAVLSLPELAKMSVPTVETVQAKLGSGALYYIALGTMLVATYTTLSVFFMAEGKVLALYAQQGALPQVIGRYSTRSVPWVAIVFLAVFTVGGTYITEVDFVISVLEMWATTLYLVIAIFFLRMRASKTLERPLEVKYGVPIAWCVTILTAVMTGVSLYMNWKAGLTWVAVVIVFILYDQLVVPRTKRGGYYREQVTRLRTSAVRI